MGTELTKRCDSIGGPREYSKETYAREILTLISYGLDKILTVEQGEPRGILNGIEWDKINPKQDPMIPVNYDLKTFEDKVQKNKLAFQKEMDLEVNADIPLIGMVTTLLIKKGIDLILQVKRRNSQNRCNQLVILGMVEMLITRVPTFTRTLQT